MVRRTQGDDEGSRVAILDAAMRAASVEGLEGLSIGQLAKETAMSRSGLFELFGSKRELQERTLRAAIKQFHEEVWMPATEELPGRARLLALCRHWLSYHEQGVLPGGCLLTTAAIEWDARPGPLRDLVAETFRDWLALLAEEVERAQVAGKLPTDLNPGDVAFELNALASAASWNYRLSGDAEALERAGRTMQHLLAAP